MTVYKNISVSIEISDANIWKKTMAFGLKGCQKGHPLPQLGIKRNPVVKNSRVSLQPSALETSEQHPLLHWFGSLPNPFPFNKRAEEAIYNRRHNPKTTKQLKAHQSTIFKLLIMEKQMCTSLSPSETQNTQIGRKSTIKMKDLEQIVCVKLLMSHPPHKQLYLRGIGTSKFPLATRIAWSMGYL